ncbi:hypothetical protein CMU99_16245 [Elizabethkingia anophelis]|nr:hypothetical protein [Elizabethkingia anophelis]
MKRLEQIREEYAKTRGFESWDRLNDDCLYDRDLDAIATIYAREVAQASLEKAAENAATIFTNDEQTSSKVFKPSITNESNIVLL